MRQTRLPVIGGCLLALSGLVTAFGSVGRVSTFDNVETVESFVYVPGLIIAALGGLAILYAVRASKSLLWIVVFVSLLYSTLIIFGAGPLPLIAAIVLLFATIRAAISRRSPQETSNDRTMPSSDGTPR